MSDEEFTELADELREAVTRARNNQPYDRARLREVAALLSGEIPDTIPVNHPAYRK